MLHVFFIDKGCMLTFDTHLAYQTTHNLQNFIAEEIGIPVDAQVLLISGGEVLDPAIKVSAYGSAGTDTNPIFLICRLEEQQLSRILSISSCNSHSSNVNASHILFDDKFDDSSFRDLKQTFDAAKQLSRHSFDTLKSMTSLARRMADYTHRDADQCSRLVHEQHMLNQGWYTVMANLDDTTKHLSDRVRKFKEFYRKFLTKKSQIRVSLENFEHDLEILKKIPLLDCLKSDQKLTEDKTKVEIGQSNATTVLLPSSSSSTILNRENENNVLNLYDWISSQDPNHSLIGVARNAEEFLKNLDESVLEKIDCKYQSAIEQARNLQMREITGIHKRLAQLDELVQNVEELRMQQSELAESFGKQENSALKLADASILSDLYQNQIEALRRMLNTNYHRVWEICGRFYDAKHELLKVIKGRLRWVADIQALMSSVDSKLLIYREKLKLFQHHVILIKQIHEAPELYVMAVSEVFRRKSFSSQFLEWANKITSQMHDLHASETDLRERVELKLHSHFLLAIFPGLIDERPSKFALDPPALFDQHLVNIQELDIRLLRDTMPESLASKLQICQPNVFAKLYVENPRQSSETLSSMGRRPSFFANTPPKFLTKSVPCAAWMSGDENLEDFSPSRDFSSHMQQFPMQPIYKLKETFISNGSQILPKSSVSCTSVASTIDNLPMLPQLALGNNGKPSSAPIRIPSRPGSDQMSVSHQLSEKSSHFGTPEEGGENGNSFDNGGSLHRPSPSALAPLNSLESPPELISASQLHEEIGRFVITPEQSVQDTQMEMLDQEGNLESETNLNLFLSQVPSHSQFDLTVNRTFGIDMSVELPVDHFQVDLTVNRASGIDMSVESPVEESPRHVQCIPRREHFLSIMTVNIGDYVLVVYEAKFRNYIVYSLQPCLFFVCHKSYKRLNLKLPSQRHGHVDAGAAASTSALKDDDHQSIILGRVLKKDFVKAKKVRNRFNVELGTKFYLVELEPHPMSWTQNKEVESERKLSTGDFDH